jgi:hypothetical protein
MAEGVVDKRECEACAAEIREGSLFCYNCGRSLEASVTASGPATDQPAVTPEPRTGPNGGNPLGSAVIDAGSGVPQKTRAKRGRRSYVRAREKVTWVAREEPPRLFIGATVAIVVFSAMLLIIAMLLK